MNFIGKQNEILDKQKNGIFVVKAAPGSGKTYTISKKAMDIINDWNFTGGLALLSFTNAAIDEMNSVFNKFDSSFEIQYPHFIGTLDSFINNYIFLPFAYLEMGCKCRPNLVGKPFNDWVGSNYSEQQFIEITWDINGDITRVPGSSLRNGDENNNHIIKAKKRLINKGFANRADANYIALKVLKNHKDICKLLIRRFPYIILDESQDTSDIQMSILDLLVENGLSNLILVGDPEQAIYEWNNADPMLFENKFKKWKKNSIVLSNNFRCSSSICKFISNFSHTPYESVNNDNILEIDPQFITYSNESDIYNIISKFISFCKEKTVSYDKESIAILFRSQNFVYKFNGMSNVSIFELFPDSNNINSLFSRFVVEGKYLWDLKYYKKGFELLEKAFMMSKEQLKFVKKDAINLRIEKVGLFNHRMDVLNFINEFPIVDKNMEINNWISDVNKNHDLGIELKKIRHIKKKYLNDSIFKNILIDGPNSIFDCHFGTVHSVKGKSFRAVMLILKEKTSGNKKYSEMLKHYDLSMEEELRIPYVAMTRAKEILWVVIPEKDKNIWEWKSKNRPPLKQVQLNLSYFI